MVHVPLGVHLPNEGVHLTLATEGKNIFVYYSFPIIDAYISEYNGRLNNSFQEGQRRPFPYPFYVAIDAMQMDVHKTLHPFYTTKKIPHVMAAVAKHWLRWQP